MDIPEVSKILIAVKAGFRVKGLSLISHHCEYINACKSAHVFGK